MNTEIKEGQSEQTVSGGSNRCPDYEEDCSQVKNHLQCFLGLPVKCSNGVTVETGLAHGYCPFIHATN